MIFKKLTLKNIRSYSELEITFPKGSTLLSGNIGAGKTSILLALQFAIFGLQPGQKGGSILRNGEESATVKLEFEIDNKDIIVERTIKRSKSGSITQENNLLTINGDIEDLSTSEMKMKMISLLDYPREFAKKSNLLYKFTVYTPQEEMKSIIQERPEVRLDTLRHIFGIDRYKRIKENSQILLQNLKESLRIKDVLVGEVNLLREKLTLNTEKKIQLTRETNNRELELRLFLEEKNKLEGIVEELRKSIDEKRSLDSEISRKETELQGKRILKERLQKEIFNMNAEINPSLEFSFEHLKSISELLEKHKRLTEEIQAKYLELNSKISVLNAKRENSLELKEKIVSLESCPTCFQSVTNEHKEKISKRTKYNLEDLERELEPLLFERQTLLGDLEKEKNLIRGYEEDKAKLERDKITFEHQRNIEIKIKSDSFILDRTQNEFEEIKKEIETMRVKSQAFSETQLKFEEVQNKLSEKNRNLRTLEIVLAEKRKELDLLRIGLEELAEEISKKEIIKSQIVKLRSLQDWIQDKFLSMITLTEKNVLAKLRGEFSKVLNEWFISLVEEDLSVRLDEDFTPIISNQDYEIDYEFLSGGERTAVALAYRLALNQTLNSIMSNLKTKDILILDEPTDGFSEQQLDKMRDIFDQLSSQQIILVSHEQKIEGFVDNVIKVEKEGFSRVNEM